MKRHVLNFALASSITCFALSGCKSEQTPATSPATAPEVKQETQPAAPAGVVVDAQIPPELLDISFALVSPPTYVADIDTMRLKLRVENKGKAMVVGQGKAPVNAGVILVGPAGPDTAPGRRDFVRTALPVIEPGATTEIVAELPANDLNRDLKVRVELVQEGIAWFDKFGLDIGNFGRCTEGEKSLCDANGSALTVESP